MHWHKLKISNVDNRPSTSSKDISVKFYLAVNIVMNSEDKNGDHAATKELVEKLINSGVQLTDLHFAFKLTIYFRPYNNERVMNEATGIVQAILPLL